MAIDVATFKAAASAFELSDEDLVSRGTASDAKGGLHVIAAIGLAIEVALNEVKSNTAVADVGTGTVTEGMY